MLLFTLTVLLLIIAALIFIKKSHVSTSYRETKTYNLRPWSTIPLVLALVTLVFSTVYTQDPGEALVLKSFSGKVNGIDSTSDVTIGGASSSEHYINDAMQPIEIMQMTFSHEEMLGFLKGNIIKYSFRAGKKQGESAEKDLNKVKQYKMWPDIVLKGGIINPRINVI